MTVRVRGIRVAGLATGAAAAALWLAKAAAALAGVPGLGGGASGGASGGAGTAAHTLDGLVAAIICGGGALAAGYLALATVAAWAEAVVTGTWRGRGLPLVARRFLVASVAASVALGAGGQAGAADAYPGWVAPSHEPASAEASPTPAATTGPGATPSAAPSFAAGTGQVPAFVVGPATGAVRLPAAKPARAVTPPRAPAATAPHPRERATGERDAAAEATTASGTAADADGEHLHVVKRGESLWRIAAAQLGPGATDAQVAAAWPSIYAANKPLIGDDPGLIFPGQRLRIPAELAR